MPVTREPRLTRPITLQFWGDWGQANMHRICGWLAQEIGDRSPPGSRFAIWSGRGGTDAVDALVRRTADVAIATPTAATSLFLHRGADRFTAVPDLRCLGVIGQDDRLVVAVDESLGVDNVGDLARLAPRLRIATSPDDGVNLVGFAAHVLLRHSGVEPHQVAAAGASFLYDERPFPLIEAMRTGAANVLIQEAVMMPGWQRLTENRGVRFLPVPTTAAEVFARWSWPTSTLAAGYLPGLEADLTTLDFSDFALLCRADLPDDVASLLAWCAVKTRPALEAQYASFPPDRTPVTYPITLEKLTSSPIPMHPAAEAAYGSLADDLEPVGTPIWSGSGRTETGGAGSSG